MTVINHQLCSPEAQRAFAALEEGKAVRRASWPQGQSVRRQPTGMISVLRAGSTASPPWMGPSSAEKDAVDWQVM
jgi:hypothetical protein